MQEHEKKMPQIYYKNEKNLKKKKTESTATNKQVTK